MAVYGSFLERKNVIHHLSVVICDEVYSQDYVWDCSQGRICKPGTPHRVGIYTWGRQSGGWTLPQDTGVTIGSKKKYIVFEVHSGNIMDKDDTAQTGIEVTLRSTRPLRESGVALLGNTGKIPPKVSGYYTDSACVWSFNTTVQILTYSVHTHSLGKAISGYLYRNNTWIEIGRADPSYPERLMDISFKNLYIAPGDIVASRCTYENPKDRYVEFGHGATDEMCNFHIHYSYPAGSNDLVRHVECAWDAESFHWGDHFPDIPVNASNTEDSDQTVYIKKYHWTHHNYNL